MFSEFFSFIISFRTLLVIRHRLLLLAVLIASSGCASQSLQGRNQDLIVSNEQSCWDTLRNAKGNENKLASVLDRETELLQTMVEELLASRAQTMRIVQKLKENMKEEAPMPPGLQNAMKKKMRKGLSLTDGFAGFIARHSCWLRADPEMVAEMGLDPANETTRLKGVMLSLSASLMLYDTYLGTLAVLNEDERIRRFLNASDLGYGIEEDQMEAITQAFLSRSNALYVQEGIDFYSSRIQDFPASHEGDNQLIYLSFLIEQSPSFALLREGSSERVEEIQAETQVNRVRDNLHAINRSVVGGVSGFFGNVMGLVEERKGKLYDDSRVLQDVGRTLKPGDILLEKTPFRLTDRLIPGHWGHAAIWVGNEEELKRLGLWEHPVVQKHHNDIRRGASVVEALRDGVQMNTLEDFLNIDDLAVLRMKSISNEDLAQSIVRAFRQIGKEYDFNFDVETTDKIVCSELVYLVYPDPDWPTDRIMGRYTISPDHVARKALKDGPLSLILLYHDGRIQKNRDQVFEELMTEKAHKTCCRPL
ncbi:MAG: Poxvirus G6 [Deltaproteobacteria bacterium]|nr:Poxvirus G6 [Deltaproteobacteria bacterium]